MLASLIKLIISLITLPLRMLSKNFVGSAILFGLLYLAFWPADEGAQPVKAPPKRGQQIGKDGKPMIVIDPVRKVEDGNSRFSADLLGQMSPEELRHYSSVFYWVMRYQGEGTPHNWAYYNIRGSITPFSRFENGHGHECRKFKEELKVHDTLQTLDGLTCERPDGGWCRLRFDSAPLCGIAEKGGLFQGVGTKLQNLF
jgi:surface antigen